MLLADSQVDFLDVLGLLALWLPSFVHFNLSYGRNHAGVGSGWIEFGVGLIILCFALVFFYKDLERIIQAGLELIELMILRRLILAFFVGLSDSNHIQMVFSFMVLCLFINSRNIKDVLLLSTILLFYLLVVSLLGRVL